MVDDCEQRNAFGLEELLELLHRFVDRLRAGVVDDAVVRHVVRARYAFRDRLRLRRRPVLWLRLTGRFDQVLTQEPGLQLVGAQDFADDQVVGAVIAELVGTFFASLRTSPMMIWWASSNRDIWTGTSSRPQGRALDLRSFPLRLRPWRC